MVRSKQTARVNEDTRTAGRTKYVKSDAFEKAPSSSKAPLTKGSSSSSSSKGAAAAAAVSSSSSSHRRPPPPSSSSDEEEDGSEDEDDQRAMRAHQRRIQEEEKEGRHTHSSDEEEDASEGEDGDYAPPEIKKVAKALHIDSSFEALYRAKPTPEELVAARALRKQRAHLHLREALRKSKQRDRKAARVFAGRIRVDAPYRRTTWRTMVACMRVPDDAPGAHHIKDSALEMMNKSIISHAESVLGKAQDSRLAGRVFKTPEAEEKARALEHVRVKRVQDAVNEVTEALDPSLFPLQNALLARMQELQKDRAAKHEEKNGRSRQRKEILAQLKNDVAALLSAEATVWNTLNEESKRKLQASLVRKRNQLLKLTVQDLRRSIASKETTIERTNDAIQTIEAERTAAANAAFDKATREKNERVQALIALREDLAHMLKNSPDKLIVHKSMRRERDELEKKVQASERKIARAKLSLEKRAHLIDEQKAIAQRAMHALEHDADASKRARRRARMTAEERAADDKEPKVGLRALLKTKEGELKKGRALGRELELQDVDGDNLFFDMVRLRAASSLAAAMEDVPAADE